MDQNSSMNTKLNFKDVFSLDLRALAVVRILFASILIFDLISRSRDLVMHYTDAGVLPVHFLIEHEWRTGYLSFHTLSGDWEWQAFLFIVQVFFAITLLIGYKSKLSLFVSWILLISLHNRNPLILNSGDTYFRILLFWCLFLPMGARYSIDNITHKVKYYKNKFFNIGTIGFIVQIMLIYLMGVLFKSSSEWLQDGTALYYALSLDQMVTPFGSWLLNFPELLKFLTFSTVALEFIAPILFIIPYKNPFFRIVGIFLLLSLHIGIDLTLHVGIFSFICMAALIGLFPTKYIQLVEKKTTVFFYKSNSQFQKQIEYSEYLKSTFVSVIGTMLLVYTLIWNINTLPTVPELIPEKAKTPAYFFRINQKWTMFAPQVLKNDGWYIFEALLDNGKKVELFHQTEITDTDYANNKPDYLFQHYKNARWRKYFENLFNNRSDLYYEKATRALVFYWNKNYSESVVETQIFFIHEPSLSLGFDPILNKNTVYIRRKE